MTSQPRNRIVVFRLSQDEYKLLSEVCQRSGGRNISEFTRSQVLAYLKSGATPDSLQLHVTVLEQEIVGLKAAVMHLSHLVRGDGKAR